MKKGFVFSLLVLFFLPLFHGGCQNVKPTGPGGIFVSDAVQKTAKWAGFDYDGVLARAKTGDYKAILEFLEFHGTLDGMDGINHGTTCLELVAVATDDHFASVCQILKPKLRDVVLERMMQGASRTKNPALNNKSLTETCPMTWAALTGKAGNNGIGTDRTFDKGTPMPDNVPVKDFTPDNAGKGTDAASPASKDAAQPTKTDAMPGAKPEAKTQTPAAMPAPNGGGSASIKLGKRQ